MAMRASFSPGTANTTPASLKRNRALARGTRRSEPMTSNRTGRRCREMRPMDVPYETDIIGASCAENPMPPRLAAVLNEFHRQHISYCYWKSRRRLNDVLAGAGDLDLLVARADQHRVLMILSQWDFKLFPSVGDRDHPAILSFLGYDQGSGQLIHIHLHFRLIIGERLLKNYRIPWEEVLLNRAILHPTLRIRILESTSEAVLLVVRACLELKRLDLQTLCAWQATTRK